MSTLCNKDKDRDLCWPA